jgi:hypothetical protein
MEQLFWTPDNEQALKCPLQAWYRRRFPQINAPNILMLSSAVLQTAVLFSLITRRRATLIGPLWLAQFVIGDAGLAQTERTTSSGDGLCVKGFNWPALYLSFSVVAFFLVGTQLWAINYFCGGLFFTAGLFRFVYGSVHKRLSENAACVKFDGKSLGAAVASCPEVVHMRFLRFMGPGLANLVQSVAIFFSFALSHLFVVRLHKRRRGGRTSSHTNTYNKHTVALHQN